MTVVHCDTCQAAFDCDPLALEAWCPVHRLTPELPYRCSKCRKPCASTEWTLCPECADEGVRVAFEKGVLRSVVRDNTFDPSEGVHEHGGAPLPDEWGSWKGQVKKANQLGLHKAAEYLRRTEGLARCKRCHKYRVPEGHGAKFCPECRIQRRREQERQRALSNRLKDKPVRQ